MATPGAARGRRRRHVGSTYRLQLAGVGLAGAADAVPLLGALGIETLYVSPLLQAAAGSTHGYDVVDATRLDPGLGTEDDLEVLLGVLDRHDMGLLVDIVPNHMAACEQNRWWVDVLRHGPASRWAAVFDIDWAAHDGRVLLPVLGRPLGDALAAGELFAEVRRDVPWIGYFDRRFPVDPATWRWGSRPGRRRLSPSRLAGLLADQHYRLAFWRLARHQVNYRRFFDVDGLVGVRVEDPAVYRRTHRHLLELARHRRLVGVRVDHVDGLADPAGYLRRLRRDLDAAAGDGPAPVIVVEKILERGEPLPADWPVEGTTGYEWADLAGGLLLDPAGAARLAGDQDFAAVAVACRRAAADELFPGLFAALASSMTAAVEDVAPGRDLDGADVRAALTALTAHLGVYRTYSVDGTLSRQDRSVLTRALAAAGADLGGEASRAAAALHQVLVPPAPASRPALRRWQQISGAVAAKGVEDTALYRYQGCLAAAEVGGRPEDPAVDPAGFHQAMQLRRRQWPGGLNTLTTHDTKRSADVRARLAVLSEIPAQWGRAVERWSRWHRAFRQVGSAVAVDDDQERFVYQTVVGAWPPQADGWADFTARIGRYVHKAQREAKQRTSWLDPAPAHEQALQRFVEQVLHPANRRFRRDVERLLDDIGPAACTNSLALVTLQATTPGVPDLYQGGEGWALTLVDPDNRVPLDLAGTARRLRGAGLGSAGGGPDPAGAAGPGTGLGSGGAASRGPQLPGGGGWPERLEWRDESMKVRLTAELLAARRGQPQLFSRGRYQPVEVRGPTARHVVAFCRRYRHRWALVVVPRLTRTLAGPGGFPTGAGCWGSTAVRLPDAAPARWERVVGGGELDSAGRWTPVADVLGRQPVAVLTGRS